MPSDLGFYPFACVLLILLCLLLRRLWRGARPLQRRRNRRDQRVNPNRLQASRASPIARRVSSKSGLTRRYPARLHPA